MRIDLLLMGIGILFMTAGCASRLPFPETTLTGRVVEVTISEALIPHEIIVKQGDEVRWINMTGSAVDISFVKSLDVAVSCQKGFVSSGWGYLFGGSDVDYLVVATVYSHDYASLCFSTPGTYTYTVRMDKTGSGKGGTKIAGTVTVE